MEEFCGSTFWDWDLTWTTTESPDFTPCFERTVLFSVPCLFLWLLAPVDILCSIYSNGREVPWSPLMSAKLAMSTLLVLLESGLFLMQVLILPASIQDYVRYPVDIYVPIVREATLFLSMGLLIYSRRRGVRSSGVQFLFWLLVTIVQAIKFRTVVLSGQEAESKNSLNSTIFILEVIYFPVVVGQLILHSWADMVPVYQNDFEEASVKNSTPETNCSFLSKILFEWYTPLVWTGFRKPLEYSNLYSLNWNLRSQNAVANFDKHWPKDLNKGCSSYTPAEEKKPRKKSNCSSSVLKNKPVKSKDRDMNGNVFKTFLKTFRSQIFVAFLLRIVPDLMALIQPLVLNQLIAFVGSDEPTWKGLLYAVILLLNSMVAIIFAANGIHLFYHIGIAFKSALVSAIYRKSLLLSNSAKREKSTGEIVNHMAVDVNYVADVSQNLNHIFTSPIIFAVCLYSLWNLLGVAALAGIVAMILIMPLNAFIARIGQKLQKKLMGYKDKRTKMMSEVLNGIKCIKLYAWEPSFEKQVMEIRTKELKVLKHIGCWNALSTFLWTCSSNLVAIVTFGTYVLIDSNNVLDAQTAFVSISLFNIMAQPLAVMPMLINVYIQASVGFKRLNGYLNADEVDTEAVSHDNIEKNPVAMENASFSWDENARAGGTLHNINLQVKQGELVAIVGPVGCGKSSLLSSLLNELVKTSGRVNIRGRIAYVAQLAWIQNASVRDNILFGSPYDSNKYKRVIDACALTPDLEILPAGDKTEIGEKGINLSGGQKQRVSLARAVYSNADIFLLDDPLSAVDAKVGKHIFNRVLGPKGLLRGKTRLLVTHGIVHLPFMDNIVVLMDGRISETGTYQALQDRNGAFADFLKQHTTDSASQEEDTKAEVKLLKKRLSSSRTMSVDSESEVSSGMKLRRFSSKGSLGSSKLSQVEVNKLIESEKMETTSVSSTVYMDYFRAAGWSMVGATMLMYMCFQGFAVGGSLWLSVWTNAAVPHNGTETNDQPQNGYYFSIYGLLGVLQTTSLLLGSIIMTLAALKSANVLHLDMLASILRAPVQFFDVTPLGRIVNRFSKDVDSLDSVLPLFLRHLISSIFQVFGVLITISISSPLFTIVILPVGLFYYFLQRVFVATSRQLKRLESTSKSPIYSHFGETVAGASTIKAYGQQERFILESERRQDHNMVSYYSMMCSNRWLQIRLELVGSTVVFFAALLSVLGRDTLSAGMVGLSISSGMYFTTSLLLLIRFTSDVETNIVAVERMKEYSQCQQEAPWNNVTMKPPHNWPESGAIVFDQYKTRYRSGLDLVLKNVTCSINSGEKVGIVGRTGAGKSSVTLALFRILEGAGGNIEIDGKDISKLGLHDVRGRLAIIPQDPMLFSSSLKMNLDPFGEKRDDELWRALELAHLKSFVDGLPGGLNFEVTEGGENLSVGQRQLVCLARALLRKTKILVLDEATSAVDLDTEELIIRTIKTEFRDSTVITIAHRLNTIMDSDRVIVLEDGQVVEVDSPKNFLSNDKCVFYGMAKEAGLTDSN